MFLLRNAALWACHGKIRGHNWQWGKKGYKAGKYSTTPPCSHGMSLHVICVTYFEYFIDFAERVKRCGTRSSPKVHPKMIRPTRLTSRGTSKFYRPCTFDAYSKKWWGYQEFPGGNQKRSPHCRGRRAPLPPSSSRPVPEEAEDQADQAQARALGNLQGGNQELEEYTLEEGCGHQCHQEDQSQCLNVNRTVKHSLKCRPHQGPLK